MCCALPSIFSIESQKVHAYIWYTALNIVPGTTNSLTLWSFNMIDPPPLCVWWCLFGWKQTVNLVLPRKVIVIARKRSWRLVLLRLWRKMINIYITIVLSIWLYESILFKYWEATGWILVISYCLRSKKAEKLPCSCKIIYIVHKSLS